MLRAVVSTFLETLTEREFDAPLLALLSSQGFTDIHFIHGGFEFGKDVIAKRLEADGTTLRQYSIQSKAGDIGQPEWRAVRPQLEECEYNTRAHPSFDADLPRVAVLVATGILKGGAPVDAQEFKAACANRGLADFEVWDRNTIPLWDGNRDPSDARPAIPWNPTPELSGSGSGRRGHLVPYRPALARSRDINDVHRACG